MGAARSEKRTPPSRAAYLRYAAFQIPGQLLAAAFSYAAWKWFEAPGWAALTAFALWVAKDAAMARFIARSYEPSADGGPHDLRGRVATTDTPLAPEGFVRLGPERWRARLADGADRVPSGARVQVVAIDGLVLVVASETSSGA